MIDLQHLLEYYSLVDAMNIYKSELNKELLRDEYLWNKYGYNEEIDIKGDYSIMDVYS